MQEEKMGKEKSREKLICNFKARPNDMKLVCDLLDTANKKTKGQEITFTDIVIKGLGKIDPKDIKELQDASLSSRDKIEEACRDYNLKNGSELTMDEFVCMKLKLQ